MASESLGFEGAEPAGGGVGPEEKEKEEEVEEEEEEEDVEVEEDEDEVTVGPVCPGSSSWPTRPLIIWFKAAVWNACPCCCPPMAARTLKVVAREPKGGGGMLGAKGGRVNTTLAWGWGPACGGGGGAVGVVVGVLGPVVVAEELAVEL